MLEKAIGWGIIYHLEVCIYDGWRPPVHEPFLVLGEWIYKRGEPITSDFDLKKKLYHKYYPNVKIKQKCACALEESKGYFSSDLD